MGHEIENSFHGFSMLSFSVNLQIHGKEFMGYVFHGFLMLSTFARNFTGYSCPAITLLLYGKIMAH